MDSGPQAYGLGRSSGQVDYQQFLKTTPVLVRLLCLKFSLIAFFCISLGAKGFDEHNSEYCIYDKSKNTPCYYGVQASFLGVLLAIAFTCSEYFMWTSSSVKHRKRIVTAGLVAGGIELLICCFVFVYIIDCWMSADVDENTSTTNANFAIFFLFLDIISWGYFVFLENVRMKKGVDPEFMGISNEDVAQFTTYAAEDNEYQDQTNK